MWQSQIEFSYCTDLIPFNDFEKKHGKLCLNREPVKRGIRNNGIRNKIHILYLTHTTRTS